MIYLLFIFNDTATTKIYTLSLHDALPILILFHTFDKKHEVDFDFTNRPKRFVDVETGEHINLYADNIKHQYEEAVQAYFQELQLRCAQYRIKYVGTDINESFNKILTTYLVERQKFG